MSQEAIVRVRTNIYCTNSCPEVFISVRWRSPHAVNAAPPGRKRPVAGSFRVRTIITSRRIREIPARGVKGHQETY